MINQFMIYFLVFTSLVYTNSAFAQKADCNASDESRYNIDGQLRFDKVELSDLQSAVLSKIDFNHLSQSMKVNNKLEETFLATLISFNGDKVVLIEGDKGIRLKKLSQPQLRFKMTIHENQTASIEAEDLPNISIEDLAVYFK